MGIANIINTSTSSGGGGGEIIRELINSSDGQGLFFSNTGNISLANNAAAEFGTSDFSIEFILNQTGEVGSSGGSIYQSATTTNNKFSIENHVASNVVKLIFFNAVGSASQYDLSYNMAADYNEPTHYVVSCDRDGNAVLYRNGTEVASVAIHGSVTTNLGDGVTSTAMIGNSGSGYTFLGGLYRFRTWNKALSHDEVDTCFQRADVPFESQYGSETNLVNPAANGDFSGAGNWVGQGNHAVSIVSNELKVVASGASTSSSNAATLVATYGGTDTNGKVYTWTFTARASSGTPTLRARTPFDHSDVTTGSYKDFVLSTSNQTFSITGKRIALENGYFGLLEAGTFFIDNIKATQIGAVTDYDLAFANPTQSLMVQDRAGVADGTATAGVSQTQKIVQLNATAIAVSAATARTPDDGTIVADKVGIATASPRALVDYGPGSGDGTLSQTISEYQSVYEAPQGTNDISRNIGFAVTTGGVVAAINAVDDGGSNATGLTFNTGTAGAIAERMRINSAGNVSLEGSNDVKLTLSDQGTPHTNDSNFIRGRGATGLQFNSAVGGYAFEVAGSEKVAISAAGFLGIGVGASAPLSKINAKGTQGNWRVDPDSVSDEIQVLTTNPANDGFRNYRLRANAVAIESGGSERLTIDTAGLVTSGNQVKVTSSSAGSVAFSVGDAGTGLYNTGSNSIGLATNGVRRQLLTSSGYTLFNCGDVPSTSVAGMAIFGSSSANLSSSGSATTSYNHWIFINGNGTVGSISSNGSATAFTTSSDYRLKENLKPLTGALDRIEQLPVYRFNFKADSEKTVDGFVAHEAQAIVPEAVTGEKDAMKTVVVQEAVEAVEYQAEIKAVEYQLEIKAVEYQPAIEAVEYQPATYYEEGDELPEGVEVGDIKTEEIKAVEGRPEIQAVEGQPEIEAVIGQPEIEAVEAQEEVTEEQPDYQGIDQSKLLPLLFAAVKELKTKVEALENA